VPGPGTALPVERQNEIRRLLESGLGDREIGRRVRCDHNVVSRMRRQGCAAAVPPCDQESKKRGEFNWREACQHAKQMQALKKKMSWSQGDDTEIILGDGKDPVILATFGDQHIGSYGADYDIFERITDEIKSTPGLYVALLGDEVEFAVKLRSVLEVTSQVLTPEMQEAFLEGWLDEIQHKVAFALWSNHGVMRQEQQGGTSAIKNILSRRVHYFNGIGHADLRVGKQIYKTAASHKFRGGSMFNRMHAQGRYVRQQASDRELVMQGDIHQWGFAQTEDGGEEKVYITGGTLHTNSGYAKRFFSLKTAPNFPCVVLHHDRHEMVPFRSIANALKYLGR
jgi:hypothetical protein